MRTYFTHFFQKLRIFILFSTKVKIQNKFSGDEIEINRNLRKRFSHVCAAICICMYIRLSHLDWKIFKSRCVIFLLRCGWNGRWLALRTNILKARARFLVRLTFKIIVTLIFLFLPSSPSVFLN